MVRHAFVHAGLGNGAQRVVASGFVVFDEQNAAGDLLVAAIEPSLAFSFLIAHAASALARIEISTSIVAAFATFGTNGNESVTRLC